MISYLDDEDAAYLAELAREEAKAAKPAPRPAIPAPAAKPAPARRAIPLPPGRKPHWQMTPAEWEAERAAREPAKAT